MEANPGESFQMQTLFSTHEGQVKKRARSYLYAVILKLLILKCVRPCVESNNWNKRKKKPKYKETTSRLLLLI